MGSKGKGGITLIPQNSLLKNQLLNAFPSYRSM